VSEARRSRSLFWTFAGVFLLALLIGTLLQAALSVAVLRPLAAQRAREQAGHVVERVAASLSLLPSDPPPFEIIDVLRRAQSADALLVLCLRDGRVVPDRRLGPGSYAEVLRVLARAALIDTLTTRDPMGRRTGPVREGGLDDGPPPREFEDGPPGPGPGSRRRPPPGAGAPAGPAELGPGLRFADLDILQHRPVTHDAAVWGELVVLGPARARLWSLPESRGLLLFLPVAVLAAGSAGLIMVRILARRLRALEQVAGRVIAGDLAARVEERSADEVGRLEERFNEMTAKLATARSQLQQTDEQRRRLLGDISHELATPLTSIRGYVETLLDPRIETTAEERATYLADVLDEAKRLDLLITDLLELTRLEADARPIKRVRLDWAALCRNAARRLAPRFDEAKLRLEWNDALPEAWVEADGRRLEQVVDNLLLNALRYVPAGGTVWLALTNGSPERFRLTVADDGPGIPAADLPHVFERFYRAERVRPQGGTGLGLAIVQEIVHQHDGEVRAEQRMPRGAVFVVELPGSKG
jgi:signal transduction histidine kinase